MPACPACQSDKVGKNDRIHNGTPKFACRTCGRQFVEAPTKRTINDDTRELVNHLLLERVSLAGIVRITGVSPSWLQTYVNRKYAAQVQHADVVTPKKALDNPVRRTVVICGQQGQ